MTKWPSDWMTEWLNDRLIEGLNEMTKWPSDRMTEWLSDQVTELLNDRVTEWPSDWVTEWPSDQVTRVTEWPNYWVTGWQEASQTIDRMVYSPHLPKHMSMPPRNAVAWSMTTHFSWCAHMTGRGAWSGWRIQRMLGCCSMRRLECRELMPSTAATSLYSRMLTRTPSSWGVGSGVMPSNIICQKTTVKKKIFCWRTSATLWSTNKVSSPKIF